MPHATRAVALATGVPLLAAPAVLALEAGTSCPASRGGARLAPVGGATVYAGDPANDYSQVPDRQDGDPRGAWRNTYRFDGTARFTVVCKYADGSRVALALAPGVRECRHDARSFACR